MSGIAETIGRAIEANLYTATAFRVFDWVLSRQPRLRDRCSLKMQYVAAAAIGIIGTLAMKRIADSELSPEMRYLQQRPTGFENEDLALQSYEERLLEPVFLASLVKAKEVLFELIVAFETMWGTCPTLSLSDESSPEECARFMNEEYLQIINTELENLPKDKEKMARMIQFIKKSIQIIEDKICQSGEVVIGKVRNAIQKVFTDPKNPEPQTRTAYLADFCQEESHTFGVYGQGW